MTHQTEAERAEFEAHFKCLELTQEQDAWGVSKYKHDTVSLAWEAWQAARRAPAAPVPHDVVRDACARMCDARAESLQAGNMFTAANEAFKCAMAIRTHPAYQHHLRAAMLAAAPQPPEAALVPSIAVTPEMVEAANEAYCPFGDMELALCAALQVAPIPPGAAPVQLPENIREGEPYDNPAFEALARALGVWGTAQSAVCAQFWIAAKEQST